jgi:hypothetical protein
MYGHFSIIQNYTLLILIVFINNAPQMLKNSTILMIRHAEKPDEGRKLSVAGQQRAQAYVVYFQSYMLNGRPLNLDYLFATKNSKSSERPVLTITPLSEAIRLPIDSKHDDDDFQKLADDLMGHHKYDDSNILVCWHHGKILDFAATLGASLSTLPPTSNWPSKWHGDVFGWVLRLVFDNDGKIVQSQTVCESQMMMFDDNGQPPPGNT